MVRQLSDYSWSSYPINALGKESNLCTAHPLYLALASEAEKSRSNYRELFNYPIEGQLLEDIRIVRQTKARCSVMKGLQRKLRA